MYQNSTVLVNTSEGQGSREEFRRIRIDQFGIHVEESRNGECWRPKAILRIDEAIAFAKALVEFVEATTTADEDAAYDRHIEEMAQRYQDRIDAESMALEDSMGF